MAELLYSWINDEVQLSKKVTNFEEDFSNGYLFGELLSKFNQQLNFLEEFIDKDLRDIKIKNFSLIQPTLATLGVKFDTNIASEIIQKKTGVALELLYQMKMALEKVNSNVDYSIFATANTRLGSTVTTQMKRKIINQWVKEELGLSKRISSFEEDFANGFLIGEALSKFTNKNDFLSHLVDLNSPDVATQNFKILTPFLKEFGVKLDKAVVASIISKKKDQAIDFLYQLKNAIEKSTKTIDLNAMTSKGGGMTVSNPQKKIATVKPIYDPFQSRHFVQRLNMVLDSQKKIDQEAKLHKFKLKEEEWEKKRLKDLATEEENEKRIRENLRRVALNKLQRNQNFADSWNDKGGKEHQMNLAIFRERVERDRVFKERIANEKMMKTIAFVENQKAEVYSEIDKFEATKANAGGIKESLDKSVAFGETNFIGKIQGFIKMRERDLKSDFSRKERDKRRRKMIVDQAKAQKSVDLVNREKILIARLLQESKQETEISYEIWRAYQCKNVILRNQELYTAVLFQKKTYASEIAKSKETRLYHELQSETTAKQDLAMRRIEELQLEHRLSNKNETYKKCSLLTDMLFEITEKTYMHLQMIDSEKSDQRYWRDVETFVRQQLELLPDYTQRGGNSVKQFDLVVEDEKAVKKLAEREYMDYRDGLAQWVPEKFPAIKQEEGSEYLLVTGPFNHAKMGDIIAEIANKIFFKENEKYDSGYPFYVPLKIVLLGKPFSGRKTVAAKLVEKFGLTLIDTETCLREVVMEAMQNRFIEEENAGRPKGDEAEKKHSEKPSEKEEGENSQREEDADEEGMEAEGSEQVERESDHPSNHEGENQDDEEENQSKGKSERPVEDGSEPNENNKKEELDYSSNPNFIGNEEKLKESREIIRESVLNGEPIPDSAIITCLLHKISTIFPPKTLKSFGQEVLEANANAKEARLAALNDYHTKKWNRAEKERELAEAAEEMDNLAENAPFSVLENKGFLVLGSPNDVHQAQLIEKMTHNFMTEDQKPRTELKEQLNLISKIVVPTPPGYIRRSLIRGSFDLVFNIDVSNDEVLRRALGRRVDSRNLDKYHLDDAVPPFDRTPLIENLVSVDDAANKEIVLPEKIAFFNQNYQQVVNFFGNFGNQKNRTKCVNNVFGHGDPEEIYGVIEEVMEEHLRVAADEIMEALEEDKVKKELEEEKKQEEELMEKEDLRMALTPFEKVQDFINEYLENTKSSLLSKDICMKMWGLWESMQKRYLAETLDVFSRMRRQRDLVVYTRYEQQKRLMEMLTIEDERAGMVLDFQYDYNKFVDDNVDMIEDVKVKEEMHQRVEDLHDRLFDLMDSKKEVLLKEVKEIADSKIVEREIETLTVHLLRLMQAELDRYRVSTQVATDYFSTIGNMPLSDPPEKLIWDLFVSFDGLPKPLEDGSANSSGSLSISPRLEAFHGRALKALAGEYEDPELDFPNNAQGGVGGKAAPGGKGRQAPPPPKKPDLKKPAPGAKGTGKLGAGQANTDSEPTLSPFDLELKAVLDSEKSLLRYRIHVLYHFGLAKISEMMAEHRSQVEKMEDWVNYVFSVENETTNQVVSIIRRSIEGECKIQKEILHRNFEVYESGEVLNFLTPPPVILPAKEDKHPDKFLISDLIAVLDELRTLADGQTPPSIQSRLVSNFFYNKIKSNVLFKRQFPDKWHSLSYADTQNLAYNLDKQRTGVISFREIATFIVLQNNSIITETELAKYSENLKRVAKNAIVISRDAFIEVPAWFDAQEVVPAEENSSFFNRPRHMKEILFNINAYNPVSSCSQGVFFNEIFSAAFISYHCDLSLL